MTKHCGKCDTTKPVEEFNRDRSHKDGRCTICKVCRRAYEAEWLKTNKGRQKIAERKWYTKNRADILERGKAHRREHPEKYLHDRLRYDYGIGLDDYRRMLETQGHRCAICDDVNPDGRRLVVDHDHDSQEVRGLLCVRCNRALGLLRDDIDVIDRASAYLRRASTKRKGRDAA